MDLKTIYSKTGKGVLEIKNKGGKLSRELVRVLTLIDGKSSVADLAVKAKLSDAEVSRCIRQLEEGGYIKEFAALSGGISTVPPADTSYVDDLDFTQSLPPGKKIYQSSLTEMRAREEAERMRAEAEARRKREEEERKKKEAAAQAAREEAARLAKIEAERKAKEAAALKMREETERKARRQAEEMARTTRDLSKVLEAERKALEAKAKEEAERKAREAAEQAARDEVERKKREEDDRRRREEEERRRREEEERRRREEQARKQREEAERKRREEEERRKREEEERRRREEEERMRREEEERKRREEEERRRREEEERKRREEEERLRREEEERRRREEEERRRREEEERRRREEEEARRREEDRRRAEEDRRRAEEDARRHEEERRRREEDVPFPAVEVQEIDLPPVGEPASVDFMAEFERQQEALRKRAEEEARQQFEAEQARLAMERAQREEEARLEAERRAAEEAEIRARMQREEEERRARERRREEEYQRKIQEEEERKKREAEEKRRAEEARIEADRRAREEELARKRKAAEEAERKRRELEALKRQGKVRSPIDRFKGVAIGLAIVIGLALAVIEFMPLSGYIPAIEKLASGHIKEPVSIQSVRMSALSGFDLTLESVAIGTTQDVKIAKVRLSPELASLFGEVKVVREVEVEGVNMEEQVLQRLPGWLDAALADKSVQIGRLVLRGAKVGMRDIALPALNVHMQLRPDGTIARTDIATVDNKLTVEIVPKDGRMDVSISGKGWTPPIGPPVEFTDFAAKGVASTEALELAEFDARLYGGAVKGSARVSWSGGWRADGDFEFARIQTESLLAAFTKDARSSGEAEGKGRFALQSDRLAILFDAPRVETSFLVRRGNLDGVDLVRALQVGRQGTQGGSTKFEELSGSLLIANGRYQYRNVRLAAGILNASGSFDIAPDQDVSGRVHVELRSQAQRLQNSLNVTGNLRAVVLRP
ncbi:MAG TPA: hypothetical protein VNM24_13485 [Burkholderiales bacterium]|jgi:hypothetical protein|nr:hypothetical protein [Burkholderiales bacterium]